ncbi:MULTISPECIES: hypothetical protein [Bradyrhizobium]|uniref:hypothetical protein n=1 Tax=Bradyrhizobium TaxID=374 RepID=UPI001FEF2423|nr:MULTISPECIES: hypothetical protein [Bradyrhizobium]
MSLRRMIEGLGPYPSLLLLAVPAATVEPLKLVAVAVAGKGHWMTGTAMIIACYAFSLLVLERIFVVVKPKLLTIPWFAKLWEGFVSVRTRAWRIFKSSISIRRDRKPTAPPSSKCSASAAEPLQERRPFRGGFASPAAEAPAADASRRRTLR